MSDAAGIFRLDSIPPGKRVIRIELLGYQTQDHHVLVMAGAREVICVVMQQSG